MFVCNNHFGVCRQSGKPPVMVVINVQESFRVSRIGKMGLPPCLSNVLDHLLPLSDQIPETRYYTFFLEESVGHSYIVWKVMSSNG